MNHYKMTFVSGGGAEYDCGIWIKIETNKTITFKCVDGFDVGEKYLIKKVGERKHKLITHSDGDYVLYANQSGIPFLFSPVKTSFVIKESECVPEDNGGK